MVRFTLVEHDVVLVRSDPGTQRIDREVGVEGVLFGLTESETDDLVAFLNALSGPEIEMEAPDLPDYAPLPIPDESQ